MIAMDSLKYRLLVFMNIKSEAAIIIDETIIIIFLLIPNLYGTLLISKFYPENTEFGEKRIKKE